MARRPGESQNEVSRGAFLDSSCQHWGWKSRKIKLKPWGLLTQSQEGTRGATMILVEHVVNEVRRSGNQGGEKESCGESARNSLWPRTLALSQDHAHSGANLSHLPPCRNSVHRPSYFA